MPLDPEAPEGLRPLILVVEDEPQVMRVLRAALPGHGYRVAEAASGGQALVEASSDRTLWAETYDRKATNVIGLVSVSTKVDAYAAANPLLRAGAAADAGAAVNARTPK